MRKHPLPKRDAIIIVVLVHIGLALLLVSMGSCGRSATREVDDATPAVTEAEDLEIETDYETVETEVSIDDTPAVVEDAPVVPGTAEAANEIRYVVQPGDSLWKISRTFGVTMDAISDRNDIRDPKLIRVGRELWIPNPTRGLDEASTEPATSTSADTTVTEPTTGVTTTPTEPVDLSTIETFEYEVQPGDTIWKLARTHHTTTKIIMDLNGITDAKRMRAGDKILIPKPAGE